MDCIISGISLYTQNLLLVLAYCLPDEEEEEEGQQAHKRTLSGDSTSSRGIPRKQNNQPPELRLIDLSSQAEVDKDGLTMSRFERLSSNDYHLGILPAQNVATAVASRGALEALAGLGNDVLNVALNPMSLFSSAASVRSKGSDGASETNVPSPVARVGRGSVHPHLVKPGAKIFILSPYDCILATRRDLADHLAWLLERRQYQEAWELVNQHPEITTAPTDMTPTSPQHTQSTDDFYDDAASVADGMRTLNSSAEKEKRRIGELWIQDIIETGDWTRAGQVCGKVLGTPDRWEKWVWTFAGANKFDEIVNYIPTERTRPPMPGTLYEVMLGHYLQVNKPRFRQLIERWSPDLFDVGTITTALGDQLEYRDVREDSVEDGEVGRDWRIVMESLAKLHEANGRNREALKCHIKLQDADSAMRLIKEGHLADAVADDIPSFIGLRVPQGRARKMSREEVEEATAEAITLLVDEAQHGLVKPEVVITQLQDKKLDLYTFFYLRGLWRGEGMHEHSGESRARLVTDSQSLVDQFADLAVHLFAVYDQSLLMDLFKNSTAYAFEKVLVAARLSRRSLLAELVTKPFPGGARMRSPQLHPRARLPLLQNRADQAGALPHHRPPRRRQPRHRLRQGPGRPGPLGGPAHVQHGQTALHPRAARGGRHRHQPHHAGAAHPRGAGDRGPARGAEAHHEGARDPVQHLRGRREGAAERGGGRAGAVAERAEEGRQVRCRHQGGRAEG